MKASLYDLKNGGMLIVPGNVIYTTVEFAPQPGQGHTFAQRIKHAEDYLAALKDLQARFDK